MRICDLCESKVGARTSITTTVYPKPIETQSVSSEIWGELMQYMPESLTGTTRSVTVDLCEEHSDMVRDGVAPSPEQADKLRDAARQSL